MGNLQIGALYAFSDSGTFDHPAYAVVNGCCAETVYLGVWMTKREVVWNCLLPAGYGFCRPADEAEQEKFYRMLDYFRLQLDMIEVCLADESECCELQLKKIVFTPEAPGCEAATSL